jgi:hypothetical protein
MRKNGWLTAVMLAVFVASGVRAFASATVREPMVRFIDFYIAAQKADTPMSLWERVAYGVALAHAPARAQCESPVEISAR